MFPNFSQFEIFLLLFFCCSPHPTPHSIKFWKLNCSAISNSHSLLSSANDSRRCNFFPIVCLAQHIMHVMRLGSNWTTQFLLFSPQLPPFDVKCNRCNCYWLALFIRSLLSLHHTRGWLMLKSCRWASQPRVSVPCCFLSNDTICFLLLLPECSWMERLRELIFVCEMEVSNKTISRRVECQALSTWQWDFLYFSFWIIWRKAGEVIRALKLSQTQSTHSSREMKWILSIFCFVLFQTFFQSKLANFRAQHESSVEERSCELLHENVENHYKSCVTVCWFRWPPSGVRSQSIFLCGLCKASKLSINEISARFWLFPISCFSLLFLLSDHEKTLTCAPTDD